MAYDRKRLHVPLSPSALGAAPRAASQAMDLRAPIWNRSPSAAAPRAADANAAAANAAAANAADANAADASAADANAAAGTPERVALRENRSVPAAPAHSTPVAGAAGEKVARDPLASPFDLPPPSTGDWGKRTCCHLMDERFRILDSGIVQYTDAVTASLRPTAQVFQPDDVPYTNENKYAYIPIDTFGLDCPEGTKALAGAVISVTEIRSRQFAKIPLTTIGRNLSELLLTWSESTRIQRDVVYAFISQSEVPWDPHRMCGRVRFSHHLDHKMTSQ